jgi:hypothetical protein
MIKNNFDFWTAYDNLCKSLIQANKNSIADSLKKAKMYANGLTDGWFDFMNAFEKTITDNQTFLSIDEKNTAFDLLIKLKKSLTNR